MKKRIVQILSMVLMLTLALGLLPVSAVPQSAAVMTVAELEAALAAGTSRICLVRDLVLERTLYVPGRTVLFADAPHTITRGENFAGDMFVVGENKKGASSLQAGKTATLTLGLAAGDAALTLDGNRDNMKVPVSGSLIFMAEGADVILHKNVTLANAHKTASDRVTLEKYFVSKAVEAGGAAVMVADGVLTVKGATFTNNSANLTSVDGVDPEDVPSSRGGAIYNFGNIIMEGGRFEGNTAARGGAIYNYRTLEVREGSFVGNDALSGGGAICQAGSQYAQTYLGQTEDSARKVRFENNSAGGNGGAIYFYTHAQLSVVGNTEFVGNLSKSAGGAISSHGSLTVRGARFENNKALSRGGAVYLAYADPTLLVRQHLIEDSDFIGNTSRDGGALCLFAAEEEMTQGAVATVKGCTFTSNIAADQTDNGVDDEACGGAMYISRESTLYIENTELKLNTSSGEGGAMYVTSLSEVTLSECQIGSNTAPAGHGGGIVVRSARLTVTDSDLSGNTAGGNGGALYASYVGELTVDATVKMQNNSFGNNTAGGAGGAVYVTQHTDDEKTVELVDRNSSYTGNLAGKGGAVYYTAGAVTYMKNSTFTENSADDGSDGKGGAIYLNDTAQLELSGATFTKNTASYDGGAVALYKGSQLVANKLVASQNVTTTHNGGFLYNSGSDFTLYESTLSENSAVAGGALSVHSKGTGRVYNTTFNKNTVTENGGAVYLYQGNGKVTLQDCAFTENTAGEYGGALHLANVSIGEVFDCTMTKNTAEKGGALYITKTDSVLTVSGLTVSGNTAATGPILCGNATKAKVLMNKTNYVDADVVGALPVDYWETTATGKLTLEEIELVPPTYDGYKDSLPETETKPAKVKTETVGKMFDAVTSKKPASGAINDAYGKLPVLTRSSNFMSRSTTPFKNINGRDVTVDSFIIKKGEKANNPNFGEAMLIYQAMLYKKAHPEKRVQIDISSFRFSVEAAACLNPNSRYFGYMRNLSGVQYDSYGFVRISYLLVAAASMGVEVTVLGQMDGYPVTKGEPDFITYFSGYLDKACDPAYAKGRKVSDFLDFNFCYWTSYDNNDATDMMHVKMCAVSNYIDYNGKEHDSAIYSSSANVDGIKADGKNGNNKLQTGTIVTGHKQMYAATANYIRLMADYCGQDEVYTFRRIVKERAAAQLSTLAAGGTVPAEELIVYPGSKTDNVFELYFTPIAGPAATWDEQFGPFAKHIRALQQSEDYILFTWNNANYLNSFPFGAQLEKMFTEAFKKNPNVKNRLYVNLESYSSDMVKGLVEGKNIGKLSVNAYELGAVHSKDIQLSYKQNGKREYVTIHNSLNFHGGSMSYQTNFIMVIKEDRATGGTVYNAFAKHTAKGMAEEAIAAELTDSRAVFKDVGNKWYKPAVDYTYSMGLINGVEKNTFGVNTPVTRGMFVTILARMAGVDTTNNRVTTAFTDVKSGAFYAAAVRWASKAGVVKGIDKTTFAPNVPIERQQMCVMLVNFADVMGLRLDAVKPAISFTDAAKIQKYARSAVERASRAGLIGGYDDGSFRPSGIATRAEAAQILMNLHRNYM